MAETTWAYVGGTETFTNSVVDFPTKVANGYFTRTAAAQSNPRSNVRETYVVRNSQLVYYGGTNPPSDYQPGTYRGSVYSTAVGGPGGGDFLNAYDLTTTVGWKPVEHQFVNTSSGWNKISDTYVYSSAGWKKVHEEPYNWRLYGRTAASTTAYLNGRPWKNLEQYRFTKRYNQSRLGNARAGAGMPSSYNASRDGKVIWPYGSSTYANGYVGYYFTPTSDKITIRATCDNAFTLWLNQTQVLSGTSWPSFYTTTRTVVPGDPIYVSINCRDYGVLWGACCRVANGTSINGTALLLSDTNWVSR